jgi:hypothetical protein
MKMKIIPLAALALSAFLGTSAAYANPSMSSGFPGGFQSEATGCPNYYCDTAKAWFLSHEVEVRWDGNRYVVAGAKVVYDRDTKSYYLHFHDTSGNTVNYGPLYSNSDTRSATSYAPWGFQNLAQRNGTYYYRDVPSYFMSDSVKLNWDSDIGAYVLTGASLAYDRNSKHFDVFDGVRWAGEFPQ